MCTVPRIFEKIFAAIQEKRKEASPAKMKLASWALGIGNNYYNKHKRLEKKVPLALRLKYKIADSHANTGSYYNADKGWFYFSRSFWRWH